MEFDTDAAGRSAGRVDEEERAAILKRLSQEGRSGEEEEFLNRELDSPLTAEDLVANIESDELRRQVYIVSLLAIEVDTSQEKAYLSELGQRLGLPQDFLDSVHGSFGIDSLREK